MTPFFKAFTNLKKQFPGTHRGNRCGHDPKFSSLPALTWKGTKLKRLPFISQSEGSAYHFFSQHYKMIFHKSPHLRAAIKSKSGVMRSENREKLCLTTQGLLRNIDLATMKLKEGRTLGEVLRFVSHALDAEKCHRRFSAERFFDGLNILSDAGLIFYRIPSAKKRDSGEWQAQPADIAFTYRFWQLLGYSRNEILRVKQTAKSKQLKKQGALERANQEVFANKLKRLNKGRNSLGAQTIKSKVKASPDYDKEVLISKITTQLCLRHPLEIVREMKTQIINKTYKELAELGVKLGV